MQHLVWLNGEVVPLDQAKVSINDRGFVFADGVYEVLRLYDGRMFARDLHLDRLERSCAGLKLALPIDRATLVREIEKLVARAGAKDGSLYIQVTRGVATRNPLFPSNTKSTLLFYARELMVTPTDESRGQKLWTVDDYRWRKCWVKAIGLTAAIMARNEAHDHSADEALFVQDGVISECSSSNFFIVDDRGALITHPVGERVLGGITRHIVLELAKQISVNVIERPITIDEAKRAAEMFITSTSRKIAWVSTCDDAPLTDRVGSITQKLIDAFEDYVCRDCGVGASPTLRAT